MYYTVYSVQYTVRSIQYTVYTIRASESRVLKSVRTPNLFVSISYHISCLLPDNVFVVTMWHPRSK